ncbi:MAG: hypothetical protein ACOC4E_01070 [Patescibacteria group bacterium]
MDSFEKLNAAKAAQAERKREASSQAGMLKPGGRGGQLFAEMKTLLETAGEASGDERVHSIEKMYQERLARRTLTLYNEFLEGRRGSPTHADFAGSVQKAFDHGFDLYLKSYLRLDAADAPRPFRTYEARTQGGRGRVRVSDDTDQETYIRQYLTHGAAVADELERTPEEHQFDPDAGLTTGYADQYQAVIADDPERSALLAYAFEKLRVFTDDFFHTLREALSRGVSFRDALDMATYVYGTDASLFAEMEEFGLSATEVARYSVRNRTRARVPFEKYKEVGPTLEAQYPFVNEAGERHRWVRGPQMIRKLIFKYPRTVEDGLAIVDREIDHLTQQYPDVPQQLLIDICVGNPDTYEEEIKKELRESAELMDRYPVPQTWVPQYTGDQNLFAYYDVKGAFLLRRQKADTRLSREIERIIADATEINETIQREAEAEGAMQSYSSQRRVLRGLLLKNQAKSKMLQREQRYQEKLLEQNRALYEEAEAMDPALGHFFVDLGFGETDEEVLEHGQIVVQLVVEQYGRSDGETFLRDCVDTYYQILDAGFPQTPDTCSALKDALIMSPNDPRAFYEEGLGKRWPAEVPEYTVSLPEDGLDA